MNVKNNKRRRESIEKIEKVFVELLQTCELDEIKVSDICKQADLNRTTFYANFIDIYDLADKLKLHLQEDILSLYKAESTNLDMDADFLKLFQHIRDNQLFYKTYFKIASHNDVIWSYNTQRAAKYFEPQFIDYHIEFFKAGFNAMVRKWLAGGCKESPEEMDGILKSEYRRDL